MAERKELDAKKDMQHVADAEAAAVERPARPSAVSVPRSVRPDGGAMLMPRQMTPPPGLRGPTPPPFTRQQPETPEIQASRSATLSEELKEKS